MSSLDQYIKLYRDNRDTIDAHSAPAINRLRPAALSALNRFGRLPGKRDEGYTAFSPEDVFAPDYGVNLSRVAFGADVVQSFRCDVPNVSTLLGIVANDVFSPSATLIKNCPAGLTVSSLAAVAKDDPAFVERYLGKLSDNRDAATALNTLLMQDGVVIRVSAGTRVDKTVQIVNIFNAAAPMMAVRRMLVVVERGASARLLVCDHTQSPGYDYLSSQVCEVYLEEDASLDYCDMEESSERTSRMSQLYVSQQSGSRLTLNGASLTVGRTRNEYRIDLCGRRCHTDIAAMAIADSTQTVDNSSLIRHLAPQCTSNQLFKYLLDDDARGAFEGLIYVAPGATGTDASQSDRNLLASAGARMHSDPQLEIHCDDVKCGHGAATGQLDRNALFYMQTRGIPEAEAKTMLMQAFMADVVDKVSIDGLRDRLHHLVEQRLSGEHASCGTCAASCRK